MKITKLVHSCVLVETPGRVALYDPGGWSWNSGLINVDDLPKVDRIIITHEHGDHFDADFVKAVLKKNPKANIVANEAVTKAVKAAGIKATFRGQETGCAKPFEAPHGELPFPGAVAPDNTGFHFQGEFTHPGDSHKFKETSRVLALPFIAPWGKTGDAVDLALKLKPEFVMPIHDWHYSKEAKKWLYDIVEEVFTKNDIKLIATVDGQSVEV